MESKIYLGRHNKRKKAGVQDLSWTSQQAEKRFNNLNEEGDKSPTNGAVWTTRSPNFSLAVVVW